MSFNRVCIYRMCNLDIGTYTNVSPFYNYEGLGRKTGYPTFFEKNGFEEYVSLFLNMIFIISE